jgi:AcrR family transcriptional regulator
VGGEVVTARSAPRGERRDRTDAVRNRHKLLDAARATYAEFGADASLKAVAARAGLGVGTVYRHFATPEALIEAVLADHFTELQNRAEQLRREKAPVDALGEWLDEFVTHLGEYRGLARVAMPQMQDPGSALFASCHDMRAAAGELLADAQQRGSVRGDVDFRTVLMLANAVALAAEHDPGAATPALSVLIDGLKSR